VDTDCDEWSDFDADRDGSDSDLYGGDDCDDTDADYSPDTLVEVWYDGVDHDCGEDDDYDADADGYVPDEYVGSSTTEVPASGALPGGDCNDLNAAVNPGVSETWYDGVDGNCDGASDFDADGDTHDHEDFGGDDCDDEDFRVYPGATEIWYDGVDSDCSGGSDYDVDGDGHDFDEYGGSDCDDNDPSINADATDVWYDGVDQDCRGDDDFDADKDGYVPDDYDGIRTVGVPGSGGLRAGDCDDGDVAVHPGAVEVWYDGRDNDCSGGSDYDADGDGYDSLDWADGDDCDDGDDTVYPGASDTWYDGVDQDCDGAKDDDADGDGFGDADDCDDDDPDIYPDKPGYDGCTPIDNSIEIYSGGGCKGCASGGATESSPFAWWAGLCGLLLGFRRRRRLT
jgi:MYXO-CTERM domain-containing protein